MKEFAGSANDTQCDQTVSLNSRTEPRDKRVNKRVDGRVATDHERDENDRCGAQAGRFPENATTEPQIL